MNVNVTDSRGASVDTPLNVTITVTNVDEPPAAPTKPTVVSGRDDSGTSDDESTTTLKVVWHPPENEGRPAITSYMMQYKKSTENKFSQPRTVSTVSDAAIITTITGLEADTSYEVRVQALNGDGQSPHPWSLVGTGSTNKEGNLSPVSNEDATEDLEVPENADAGQDVEGPVAATDRDSARLIYSLEGPDAESFDFDTSSGQIRTKRGVTYDHESKPTYFLTVVVIDGAGGSDATPVWVEVEDAREPAKAPARPTVRATEDSSTRLDIGWNVPDSTGPDITGYEVRYRKGSENFSSDNCDEAGLDNCNSITGTKTTITGLVANTSYEVQVRAATSGEGEGDWSASGTGRTSKANQQPIFDDRPDGSERLSAYTVSRTVGENTRAGQLVGTVRADDGDGDKLTYILGPVADSTAFRYRQPRITQPCSTSTSRMGGF